MTAFRMHLLMICLTSATTINVALSQTITIAWQLSRASLFHENNFNAHNHVGALAFALQEIETSVDPNSDLYGYTFEYVHMSTSCKCVSNFHYCACSIKRSLPKKCAWIAYMYAFGLALLCMCCFLSVHYADSDCAHKNSLGELSELLASGVTPDVVVGPLCSRGTLTPAAVYCVVEYVRSAVKPCV